MLLDLISNFFEEFYISLFKGYWSVLLLSLSGLGISNDFIKCAEEYFLLFCFLQHKRVKKRKKEAVRDFINPLCIRKSLFTSGSQK